jgi:molecular chaperone DnaJ
VVQAPCGHCGGTGRLRRTRERTLSVPPGVETGTRIRMPGEGDMGMRGGDPGDLYVVIHVKPHEIFERRGNDLYCEVPISFAKAALGGQIAVPVIGGEERIDIPEGTQPGAVFRLRDRGVPDLNGRGRGHQFVVVKVTVPAKLSADQKQLLVQFARSLGEDSDLGADRGLFGIFRRDK